MTQTTKEIAIIGAGGKTGRRVMERLQKAGHAARGLSRSTPISFDWHDETTWQPALAGVGAAYLTYHPDLSVPGAAQHIARFCEVAADCDIGRLVLLAGRGEPQVHPAEDALRGSGIEFTILECAFFSQNFTEDLLRPHEGVVAFPADAVTEPFIDCNDIADVAVEALTQDTHLGKTYDLTGPESLTFGAAVQLLSRASRQTIRYQPVSFEDYAQLMAAHLPAPHVEHFIELFRSLLDGHNAATTNDVERVLGRPATSFESFARREAGALR